MWQKVKAAFSQIPHIGVTKRNFLMISADIKKGIVIVSYKGRVKYGKFSDSTLRNMMNGVRFEKSVSDFLTGTGKLIHQIINK